MKKEVFSVPYAEATASAKIRGFYQTAYTAAQRCLKRSVALDVVPLELVDGF